MPKVQNTTAPSEVSSAKYCSSVLPPANIALSAVPARISPPGPMFFLSRDIRITTTDDIEPKTKAQSVTIYGLSIDTVEVELEFVITPPPNTIMPNAAPKAAPCDTPSVDAEARGLRSTHCITAPEAASVAPTNIAARTRGRRMFIMAV